MRVVKAFAQEPREVERFDYRNRSYVSAILSAVRTRSMFSAWMTLTTALGAIMVWGVGGRGVIMGTMSLGTVVMFTGLLWQLYGPVTTLANLNERFQAAATAAERVFEILDAPAEGEPIGKPQAIGEVPSSPVGRSVRPPGESSIITSTRTPRSVKWSRPSRGLTIWTMLTRRSSRPVSSVA